MTCSDLLRTQAWLDGELDDRAAAEAERHMRECADCQRAERGCRAMSAMRFVPTSPLSRAGRVARPHHGSAGCGTRPQAGAAQFLVGRGQRGRDRRHWPQSLAFFSFLPPSAATLTEAVDRRTYRALMRGETIEVVSSNHHTVKPWFAGRIALSPPVADFAQKGFSLAGGRVDEIAGARAAVVVYRHGAHEIDLFVWADAARDTAGATTRLGYHTVFWKRGDLDFAAVSDTEATRTEQICNTWCAASGNKPPVAPVWTVRNIEGCTSERSDIPPRRAEMHGPGGRHAVHA